MNTKKYTLLFSLILTIVISGSFIRSQAPNFKMEVTQVSDDKINVEITVTSGEPEFNYSIWENEPWENGREIENSGNTGSYSYTFYNLDRKPYFVMVYGKDGLKEVQQVRLSDSNE